MIFKQNNQSSYVEIFSYLNISLPKTKCELDNIPPTDDISIVVGTSRRDNINLCLAKKTQVFPKEIFLVFIIKHF